MNILSGRKYVVINLSITTKKKRWETIPLRSTIYPCCVSTLGEFDRSWTNGSHQSQK